MTTYSYAVKWANYCSFTQLDIRPVQTIDMWLEGDTKRYKIKLNVQRGLNDLYHNINGVLTDEQSADLKAIVNEIDESFRKKTLDIHRQTSIEYGHKLANTTLTREQVQYLLVNDSAAMTAFDSVREQAEKAEKIKELTKEFTDNLSISSHYGSIACKRIAKYLVENGKLK